MICRMQAARDCKGERVYRRMMLTKDTKHTHTSARTKECSPPPKKRPLGVPRGPRGREELAGHKGARVIKVRVHSVHGDGRCCSSLGGGGRGGRGGEEEEEEEEEEEDVAPAALDALAPPPPPPPPAAALAAAASFLSLSFCRFLSLLLSSAASFCSPARVMSGTSPPPAPSPHKPSTRVSSKSPSAAPGSSSSKNSFSHRAAMRVALEMWLRHSASAAR